MDSMYTELKATLGSAGLLRADQSSKTERYFQAYYGATALDTRYGFLAKPAYIKHYEADPKDRILVSPYLQLASREFKGYLDPAMAPYNWVIDADGRVAVIPETPNPYGRIYDKGFLRPEDKSQKKPGTGENYGHASAMAGQPGRISGELLYDKKINGWIINNKSGRYSKSNADRTPDQLVNAANLMQEVLDPGGAGWGPVRFIFEYGPEAIQAELEKGPAVVYEDPAKKKRPGIVVMASKVAPAAKKH